MRSTLSILGLLLGLALALPAGAATEVYRWVDKDGKVHYSSQKPPDAAAKALPIQSGPTAPATAPGTAPAADDPNAPTGGDNDAVKKELAALNAQRCAAAKAVAARYANAPYLESKDADGKTRRLDPEEEARERVKVKQDIDSACGGK